MFKLEVAMPFPIHMAREKSVVILISYIHSCMYQRHEYLAIRGGYPVQGPFICLPLVVVLARPRHNNIIHLEYHAAELGGQHELLLLADQRVDDKRLLHVVGPAAHAVDTETA